MYAGRVVETGTRRRGLHRPAAPLRQGAVRRLPADRRPGRALRAGRAGRRPARPADAARRLLVRAALPPGHRRVPRGRAAADRFRRWPPGRLHPGRPGMTEPVTEPVTGEPLLEARGRRRGLQHPVGPRSRAPWTASTSSVAARRDRRPGRGVRVGQDHAGPHPGRAAAARRRARCCSRVVRWTTRTGRCGAFRRQVQMILQDAAGALNPRQTRLRVGGRGHPAARPGRVRRRGPQRARPGRRGPGRGGPAAARAAVPALPARAVRRAEAARADRRRARAAARSC